jgi:hypothetical protein
MFHNLQKGGMNSYFNLELISSEVTMGTSGRCAQVGPGGTIEVTSKTDGGILEPGVLEIPAQRRAVITLGTLKPSRCNPVIEVNPRLYDIGSVDYQRVFEERGEQEIKIYLTTRKKVDLGDYDWLVRIYAAG